MAEELPTKEEFWEALGDYLEWCHRVLQGGNSGKRDQLAERGKNLRAPHYDDILRSHSINPEHIYTGDDDEVDILDTDTTDNGPILDTD